MTSSSPPPAAHCLDCAFEWHSPLLADGLRLLGSCPKCGGTLEFHDDPAAAPATPAPDEDQRPPHLVMGVPRR